MTVTGPAAVVESCADWLAASPVVSTQATTVRAWLPPLGEPSRTVMPAVLVHLVGVPDSRAAFNGAGGVRHRQYQLAVDVWWSVTTQTVGEAQSGCAELVETVIARLADDPTWGSDVVHSGGRIDARPLEDSYDDLLEGRGVFAWRITVTADLYPTAT